MGARYIYGQRLSAAGEPLWLSDGVRISGSGSGEQYSPALHRAPDGNILFSYGETRARIGSRSYWIVAQKLDASGQRLWGTNGVDVVEGVGTVRSIPDGSGGLVVFGRRQGDPDGFRFQRVLADRSIAWSSPVDIQVSLPFTPLFGFATDGAGGIILTYLEGGVVRIVRVTADGQLPWTGSANVVADKNVVTSLAPVVAADGAGGAFVAWSSVTPRDIHIQHVTSEGARLWPADGAVVPDRSSSEREAAMVADGAGGIFLSFSTASSLRGQRLDSSGAAQWQNNGTNGVSLMSGFESIIGVGASGPIVLYDNGVGLSGRLIDVPTTSSLKLIDAKFLPAGQFRFGLSGGMAGTTYNVLRATALGIATNRTAWTVVGTIQPGATWTDTSPPLSLGVYMAIEQPH